MKLGTFSYVQGDKSTFLACGREPEQGTKEGCGCARCGVLESYSAFISAGGRQNMRKGGDDPEQDIEAQERTSFGEEEWRTRFILNLNCCCSPKIENQLWAPLTSLLSSSLLRLLFPEEYTASGPPRL